MEILPELLAAFDSKKRALIKELADFKNNPYDKLRQRFAASIEGPNERTRVALEMGRPEDAIYEGIAPDPSGVEGLGKAMFVGAKAALNPVTKGKLLEARDLATKGVDNEAIRQLTGWFQGPDKKWRTEISDQLADITDRFQSMRPQDKRLLPEAFEHPDLYKLYPQLQRAVAEKIPAGPNLGVMYAPGVGDPTMDRYITQVADMLPTDQSRSTFLHELQHAVQDIEGFEQGGSTLSPRVTQYLEDWKDRVRRNYINQGSTMQEMQMVEDKYLSSPSREYAKRIEGYERLAGEAEARLTEARANLGAKGRMETPLEYDVPKEELIFHNGSTGAQFSQAPKDVFENLASLLQQLHQVREETKSLPLDWNNYSLTPKSQALSNIRERFKNIEEMSQQQLEGIKQNPQFREIYEKQAKMQIKRIEDLLSAYNAEPSASLAANSVATDIYRNQLAPYQHQVYDRLILMGTPPEEAIQKTRTLTNLMQALPSK